MKALVIAPQPFFSPRGTPFSVYYRTLVTSELGVEIDLLTYGQGEDVDLPNVTIHRVPDFPFLGRIKTGPSVLKLFLDVFIVLWTLGLLIRNRYDFVHAHEEAIFFCSFFKPLFGFKLVYDMHSSLPQQLTNFGFSKSRLLIGIFEWLENSGLRRADAVITICPELAEYAEPLLPDPSRHLLIENSIFDPIRLLGVDPEKPVSEALLSELIPPGKRIVLYAGTFETYQGIEIVVDGFVDVALETKDAFLLMLGGNPEQVARYRERAQAAGLGDTCHFAGMVPKAIAQACQSRASVLLSPRVEGMNTPLKIYEQLASGLPLVATRIPSHTQVLTDEVCILVEPTAAGVAEGIRAALDGGAETSSKVEAAKALYASQYSRPIYEGKMKHLLELLA